MGFGIPDLTGVIEATQEIPKQFDTLIGHLHTLTEIQQESNRLITRQNEILEKLLKGK